MTWQDTVFCFIRQHAVELAVKVTGFQPSAAQIWHDKHYFHLFRWNVLYLPKIHVSRNTGSEEAMGSTVRDSNPGRYKRFFSSPKRPRWLWGQPSYLFNGYTSYFPGVKRRGRDVDHSLPFSEKPKNEVSCTYTAPIHLHRVDKDNLNILPSCLTNIPQNQRHPVSIWYTVIYDAVFIISNTIGN